MHTHLVDSFSEVVNNKLHFLTIYLFYYLLYHMIPIGIINELIEFGLDFTDQDISLLGSQHFQSFLYHSASKLVQW